MTLTPDRLAEMRELVPASFADEDEVPLTYVKAGDLRTLLSAASGYAAGHAAGVMEEREGCAQLLNEHHKTDGLGLQWFADTLAKAIRSRPSPAASQPDICPTCRGCGYQDPAVGSICADCGGSGGVPAAPAVTMVEVVEVLRPFAEEAGKWEGIDDSFTPTFGNEIGEPAAKFTVGHLRKARALLSRLSPSGAATVQSEICFRCGGSGKVFQIDHYQPCAFCRGTGNLSSPAATAEGGGE